MDSNYIKRNKITAFNYKNVKLSPGMFSRQFEHVLEYYLAIPDDSLLFGFRKRTGRPVPGEELLGWYGAGIFHAFGQIVGSLAKMCSVTGDKRLKNKVEVLVRGWAECIDEDGYFYYKSYGHVNDIYYEYEKLLTGLLDAYEYANLTEALEHIKKISVWADRNFDYGRKSGEWYTLSESLYRAYEISRDQLYYDMAKKLEYADFWNKILNAPATLSTVHAYSHLNSCSGAAMAYKICGDDKYLDVIKTIYNLVYGKHTFATGMYGPAEEIFSESGYLGKSLLSPLVRPLGVLGSSEVPCSSWAVQKLCRYLLTFTGHAGYGQWLEDILYNGVGAQLDMQPDGQIMYYANYHVYGALKDVKFDHHSWACGATLEWACCTGTYPQAVTELHNMIYYHTGQDLYISQYIPSEVVWEKDGVPVIVRIDTLYPEENNIKINVNPEKEQHFSLNLRIPEWTKENFAITVNGVQTIGEIDANGWVSIGRLWRSGDVVDITFAFRLRFKSIDGEHPLICALTYGPVVLVADREGIFSANRDTPGNWITKTCDSSLDFETVPGCVKGYEKQIKKFKPFYRIPAKERYYMYNKFEAIYVTDLH